MKQRRKGERPRIGVDLHVLEGIHQGSRTHCLELFSRVIHRLPQIDFRFFVDNTRWDGACAKLFTAANAEVVAMPHTNSIARLLVQLPRLVKRHRIDLLHTQYISPLTVSSAKAITVHDILFEDYPQYFQPFFRYRSRLLVRLSARRAELVFTVSEYSKQQLLKMYGIPETRIVKVMNGVDTERFFPGDEGAGELTALGLRPGGYFLTVGRLEPRKNHAGMLRALAMLPSPRPRLVVVGQRDFEYENIFRLRDLLHLQSDVQFLETVNDELLASLYRNCKAFLYPTYAEGFGMPVLEAMASGAPVITSNTTALPEIAGGSAILVDPSSSESIASALRRLIEVPELAAGMEAKGLERAAELNWAASVEILASAYRTYFSLE
jgi:glycosyltransferase involved in cell wall biosynthesis